MSTRTDTEIQDYLDQLRHELADLPVAEVDEIVQDLEPQLAAIAGELGQDLSSAALTERLGTPTDYAGELRSAAGFGGPDARRQARWLPRTLFWVLVVSTAAAGYGSSLGMEEAFGDSWYVVPFFGVVLVAFWFAVVRHRSAMNKVAVLPEVRWATSLSTGSEYRRRVVRYLTTLRPGWFLVRAGLVWFGVLWQGRWLGWWDVWPEVMATVFAAASMMAGHRSVDDRRWLWFSVPLTGWAIGVALKMTQLLPHVANWGGGTVN